MGIGNNIKPKDRRYEYVWHCHILEHEEHDMMRSLVVFCATPTGVDRLGSHLIRRRL
jgi:hypothetical protein